MAPAFDTRPAPPEASPPAVARWGRLAGIGGVLLVAAILLFTGLGHYAFWDDEAATALGAKGILRTGDNSALLDHGNIVAYRNGTALKGFSNRVEPLLAPYLTAASFAVFGVHAWSGRLPFALFGLGTFALMLCWARRENGRVFAVLALGLIGNVSLILYARNCRYYALAIFFSLALAYLYQRRKPDRASVTAFVGLSILLFTSNYLNYLAFYVCLTLDYLVWQRRQVALGWRTLWWVCVPQLIVNGLIVSIWNPFQTSHGGAVWQNSFGDRWTLFGWQWRDTDQCEFLCFPLLLLALGLGLAQRRTLLVRGCVALTVYVVVITVVSPQVVHETHGADVRYLAPLIPLAVALEGAAICALFEGPTVLPLAAALLVFGTNLLNGGPFLRVGFRSTFFSYVKELAQPPPEPYTPTADWINAHVPAGSAVWVLPNYATYPLMVRAPEALYAWQLTLPPRPGFADLPQIHFLGESRPDYLVAFGPHVGEMTKFFEKWNRPDVHYEQVATINVYWQDVYRPEIFQRMFEPVTGFDPGRDAVYIFRRTAPPLPPDREMR